MRFLERAGTRRQFFYLCTFSILILIVAANIIFYSYSRSLLNSTTRHIDNVTEQFRNEFSTYLNEIDQIVNSLAINPTVKEYLTEPTSYRRHLLASELVDYFISLSTLKTAIKDISVFHPDGGKISYYNLEDVQAYILQALADKPFSYCLGMSEYGFSGENLLLVGCTVIDRDIFAAKASEDQKLGIVLAAVDPRVMSQKLNGISGIDNVHYVVFDHKGSRIIGNIDAADKQLADLVEYARKKGGSFETNKYRVNAENLINPYGVIITVVDKNVLWEPVMKSLRFSVGIMLCAFVLLIAMYVVAGSSIIRPIDKLIRFLQGMRHDYIGQLEERIPVEGNRDIVLLSAEFNNMLGEIHSLTHQLVENNSRLYESKIAQKQSEIALLRSQINPHFLYNTLEVIRSLAVIENVPEIDKTAKSLAKIMRYSIKGYDNVRLAEEMSIVKDYIRIQDIRFKGKFKTELLLEDAALDCVIPKMSLQPVVENAFVHGLELLPGGGTLRISAEKRKDTMLVVTVEDNGPGMDTEKLTELNQKLQSDIFTAYAPQMDGIGLLNVNSRIRLTHREGDYGISVKSHAGVGTSVELIFYVGEENRNV